MRRYYIQLANDTMFFEKKYTNFGIKKFMTLKKLLNI